MITARRTRREKTLIRRWEGIAGVRGVVVVRMRNNKGPAMVMSAGELQSPELAKRSGYVECFTVMVVYVCVWLCFMFVRWLIKAGEGVFKAELSSDIGGRASADNAAGRQAQSVERQNTMPCEAAGTVIPERGSLFCSRRGSNGRGPCGCAREL